MTIPATSAAPPVSTSLTISARCRSYSSLSSEVIGRDAAECRKMPLLYRCAHRTFAGTIEVNRTKVPSKVNVNILLLSDVSLFLIVVSPKRPFSYKILFTIRAYSTNGVDLFLCASGIYVPETIWSTISAVNTPSTNSNWDSIFLRKALR